MRPIDADRFRAWVLKENETKWGVTIEEILDAIDDCKTVDSVKRGEWIPCSERLPESYERVLLTCLVEGKRYTDLANFSMDGKVWHTFLKFWDADDIEPIAWMPLPEPYKEKDDEAD